MAMTNGQKATIGIGGAALVAASFFAVKSLTTYPDFGHAAYGANYHQALTLTNPDHKRRLTPFNPDAPWGVAVAEIQARYGYDPSSSATWGNTVGERFSPDTIEWWVSTGHLPGFNPGPSWHCDQVCADDSKVVTLGTRALYDDAQAACDEAGCAGPVPTPLPSPTVTVSPTAPPACLSGQCLPECPQNCPQPTPRPSPTASPAPTPSPTATPVPTAAPTPSPAPSPAPCVTLSRAPSACGMLDVIAAQPIGRRILIDKVRHNNAVVCGTWQKKDNAAHLALAGGAALCPR